MEVVRKPLIGSEITFNGVRCIATHARCRWMLIFNNKRTMDSYAAATVNSYTNDNKLCGRPPQYVPAPCKLTFDLESDVRLLCDVGSPPLCANFSLPSPLCSRLRLDVRDRQTSDSGHRLILPPCGVGHDKERRQERMVELYNI